MQKKGKTLPRIPTFYFMDRKKVNGGWLIGSFWVKKLIKREDGIAQSLIF